MTPTIAGLINARLLSSRLPNKLVLPFAGRTLIDVALEKLAAADFFSVRYLAAAEDELLSRVEDHKDIIALVRDPKAVQPGYNGNENVFAHCRAIQTDYIFWLNACSPLLSLDTMRRACDYVIETRLNSYTSVVETHEWIFDEAGLPVTNRQPGMLSTAHSPKFYRVAHAFHIYNTANFLKSFVPWTFTKHDPDLIRIPEDESFDVNTPIEFSVAEEAYKRAGG
jgi:CMP-N-acetylneuraminic acid synthetase